MRSLSRRFAGSLCGPTLFIDHAQQTMLTYLNRSHDRFRSYTALDIIGAYVSTMNFRSPKRCKYTESRIGCYVHNCQGYGTVIVNPAQILRNDRSLRACIVYKIVMY